MSPQSLQDSGTQCLLEDGASAFQDATLDDLDNIDANDLIHFDVVNVSSKDYALNHSETCRCSNNQFASFWNQNSLMVQDLESIYATDIFHFEDVNVPYIDIEAYQISNNQFPSFWMRNSVTDPDRNFEGFDSGFASSLNEIETVVSSMLKRRTNAAKCKAYRLKM